MRCFYHFIHIVKSDILSVPDGYIEGTSPDGFKANITSIFKNKGEENRKIFVDLFFMNGNKIDCYNWCFLCKYQ